MTTSDKKYIPINKGHFSLDTLERSAEFERKLANGWEKEYEEYRNLWVELPNKRKIRDYPLLIDLELASVCNLNCPMCYTITDEFKKLVKKGLMGFDLFKKIVDEVSGKVFSLRLSLRGEPTLHPRFLDAIKYAKSRGIKEVSSLTHGGEMDLEYFKKAADAGIDWITFSIDGVHENYNNIRAPLKFDDTLKKLEAIMNFKKKKSFNKPVIKVQGIWPSIKPNPTLYYNTIAPLVDLVAYNPLIDYLQNDTDIVYEENFSCPQLYQRLVIGSDGQAMMCSNDEEGQEIIGDANEQNIHKIWHGVELNRIRDLHNQKDGFKCVQVCKKCYYPRKATPNEKAVVGNREIWIENYVNRKQVIGK